MTSENPSPQSLTEILSAHWSGMSFDDLPPGVVSTMKDHILDTLAVAMAGIPSEESRRVRHALSGMSNGGPCLVWGTRDRLNPAHAALANGTSAHARDFDDGGGPGHAGSATLPAAIAAAELLGSNGRDLIVAACAGYDISYRLLQGVGGFAAHTDRGWHSTGTFGTFAAAAACAKILGLEPAAFANALGIAGSFTGGIWAFIEDGAWTKRLHPGKAGESGIDAAFLARAGITGPHQVFEAPWGGIIATYAGGRGFPERVTAGLGRTFNVSTSYLKPYACCRGSHSTIDAVMQLISERNLQPSDVSSVTVTAGTTAINMLTVDPIETVFDAQFSLPYAISVALENRSVGLDQFDPPRISEPRIQETFAKISMVLDPSIELEEGPRLEFELTSGERITLLAGNPTDAKGSEKNPMTHDEVVAKARSLLRPYGNEATAQLIDAVENLDSEPTLDNLVSALGATPLANWRETHHDTNNLDRAGRSH
ncbi:2-methylcitrate dehydratase PrpD [Paenarthrobacter nicotinovorans]|uniref:MmgE/PrpD family protein n=1 Tax=Micrococcaceae TaxID=1268 RepID=UPI0008773D58|nr:MULTISPECIES: MmgE/PrpD family protein [Micrococcaceae]MDR6436610.1 2-methylcitrate dehydratase PrpD [Paenarthrobacter nicotinovorans]SCZ57149.1 2-methylcitrate dehydratase PrpD [Arthrobacter sp. UNCCL28]